MRNNKRGVSEGSIDAIVAILFACLIAGATVFIVLIYSERPIDITPIAPEVYVAKLYFSPKVLLAEKDGITQFGVIDKEKFSTEKLLTMNRYVTAPYGARLRLFDVQGNNITGVENPIFDNKAYYIQHLPFAANNVRFAGGARLKRFVYPVVFDGKQAFLEIDVVIKNS